MNSNTDILIEQYLDGSLSDSDRQNFENRLQTEPTLKERLEDFKGAYRVIKAAGRLELKEKLEQFENEQLGRDSKVMPLWVKRSLPVAAILVLFFAVYQFAFVNRSLTGDEVFASNFEPYSSPTVVRNGNTTETLNWSKATELYRDGEYSESISYFENSKQEVPGYLASFYLGVATLGSGNANYQSALTNFNEVLLSDNDYRQQASWYKALTLIKMDRIEEAETVLTNIFETKSYNYERAKAILDKGIKN